MYLRFEVGIIERGKDGVSYLFNMVEIVYNNMFLFFYVLILIILRIGFLSNNLDKNEFFKI